MNRFLDRLTDLYSPLRLRGMLMDGQYRFAPDSTPTDAGVPPPDTRVRPPGARVGAASAAIPRQRAQRACPAEVNTPRR